MASQGFDRKDEGAKDSGAQLRMGVAEGLNLAEKANPGALGFAIDTVLAHPDRPNGLSQLTSYTAGGDAAKAWTEYKKLLTPDQLDGIRKQVDYLVSDVDMSQYPYKAGDVIHAIHNDLKEDDAGKIDLKGISTFRRLSDLIITKNSIENFDIILKKNLNFPDERPKENLKNVLKERTLGDGKVRGGSLDTKKLTGEKSVNDFRKLLNNDGEDSQPKPKE